MLKRKLLLTIEGNIGAGKSTVLEIIKEKIQNTPQLIRNISVIEEPVYHFSNAEIDGVSFNPLADFYHDPIKNAYCFQNWVIKCYYDQLKQLTETSTNEHIIIMERNIYSTNIFLKALHKQDILSKFSISLLSKNVEEIISNFFGANQFGTDKLYFIDTPTDICFDRIEIRNRNGENNAPMMKHHLQELEKEFSKLYFDFQTRHGENHARKFYSDSANAIATNILQFLDI